MRKTICLLFACGFLNHVYAQKGYYTPKSLVLPVHDRGNQLHVSFGTGGGHDLNLSYAFTNRWALFAAGVLKRGEANRTEPVTGNYVITKNDYILRAGISYFKPVKPDSNRILELSAGYGAFNVDNFVRPEDSNRPMGFTEVQAYNLFVQGAYTRRWEFIDLTFAARVSYTRYSDFRYYYGRGDQRFGYANAQGINFDPVIGLSYKWRGLRLNMQGGFSLPVGTFEASLIQYQHVNSGAPIVSDNGYRDKVVLAAVLGRISLQYNLNFGSRNRVP